MNSLQPERADSTTLDAGAARALTDRIKVGVEAIWDLITQAYTQRAWTALGYSSWDDYCTREFGGTRLRLPREERTEVVASLRESGLSIRAIAAATGDSRGTIANEVSKIGHLPERDSTEEIIADCVGLSVDDYRALRYVDAHRHDLNPRVASVAQEQMAILDRDETTIAEAAAAVREAQRPTPVIGLDNKTYNPKPVERQQPRRKPITDSFWRATYDFGKSMDRISRLADDDRFAQNGKELALRNLGDLKRHRQRLDEVITALEGWRY